MSFEEWSNNKKKKKTSSFEEWSNASRGITKEQEEEDEKKRQAYLLSVRNNDDDIAPVKEESEDRTWFKKSEGNWWQSILGSGTDATEHASAGFLGIGEKIADTAAMLGNVMAQGQLNQSAQDEALFNALSGKKDEKVFEKYQGIREELEKDTAEFVAKDLYDEEAIAKKIISDPMRKVGIDSEKHSVFGEKSDALAMSAGQLGGQIAVSLIPGVGQAGGMAMMGATAFGSEAENALRNGASFDEAFLSSTISAGAELLSEKLGGVKFGGKTLTDTAFGKLSRVVTGKFAKALLSTGKIAADASAESVEEIVSGYMSAWGQKLTYMDDKEIEELFTKEDALESAIGGFVLGGAFSVGEAAISGRDPVSGLTKHEQAVVDKVSGDMIAKREENGKKLTNSEKSKIRDSVVEQMEKGQIDIDTIESVLGGDAYKAYTDHVNTQKNLKTELDELSNIKSGELTRNQQKRLAELEGMNLDDTTKSDGLRKSLDDTLSPALKNSKLAESYRERERRGQAFEADLSKYTGKKRAAVERAVKSGVLNNTYRSHELVELLSTLEAEKGITFEYSNNKRLAEAGYTFEGKVTNGFANKKTATVTLNVQSAKAWQSVVGHEITHVLETNPEAYNALRESLYAYAQSKGELDSRRAATEAMYNGMDADIEAELTADMVGDYLFTDKAFINKLTGNRTLFQKVYDEIKYLWNKATGKEKTEIEKVKDEFDRVWKEFSVKGTSEEIDSESKEYSDSDVQYSIREEAPPKETGIAYKVFFVKDGKLYPPMVANPDGADTPMGVWLNADVGTAAPPSKTGRAQVKAGGKGTQGGSGSLAFRPGWHLGDLPRASQFDRVNPETGKKELFPENFVWAEVEYAKDVDYQEEAMSYGYTDKGKFRHAYAGLPRLPENGYYRYRTNPKPDTVPWVITGAMKVNRLLSDAEVNEILEKNGVPAVHRQGGDVGLDKFGFEESGKVQYSVSPETESKTLYTGSPNTNIQQFKVGGVDGSKRSGDRYGRGVYLTTNENTAKGYAGDSGKVYEINADRLNIFNLNDPVTDEMKATLQRELNGKDKQFRNSVLRNFRSEKAFTDFESAEQFFDEQRKLWKEEDGYYAANKPDIKSANDKTGEAVIEYTDFANIENAIGNLTGNELYDALKSISTDDFASFITGHGFDGISFDEDADNQQYVIYRNEDRLNILNNDIAPTPDVQYSISDSDGNQLSKEQQEFFKDSKVRDENGNLIAVYHGSKTNGFNIFEYTPDKQTGTDYGEAYYFTSDYEKASGYSYDVTKDTRVQKYHEERKNRLDRFLKTRDEADKQAFLNVTVDGKTLDELMNDESYSTGGEVKKVYLNLKNPLIVDADGEYYYKVYDQYFSEARENGNDGIIVKNVIDNPRGEHRPIDVYIAFEKNQIKNTDNINPSVDPDIRFSLSAESDADYMSAVERGDTETAQMMVDEAAKSAGYDYHLYHGTDADFTKFDLRKFGGRNGKGEGYGIYLAANREISAPYGKNVINSYTKFNRLAEGRRRTLTKAEVKKIIQKSCEIEAQRMVDDGEYDSFADAINDTWVSNYVYTYDYPNMSRVYTDVADIIFGGNDNDGDIINEIMSASGGHYDYSGALDFYDNVLTPTTGIDGFHYIWGNIDGSGVQNDIYLAFNSEQIKSADPVTYDDNGNVIPLSERFNADNNDIRYSLSKEGETFAPSGDYSTPFRELALDDDFAPVAENTTDREMQVYPDGYAPVTAEEADAISKARFETITDADAPPEMVVDYYSMPDTTAVDDKALKNIGKSLRETLSLNPQETKAIQEIVQEYSTSETPNTDDLFEAIKEKFGEKVWGIKNEYIADVKRHLRGTKVNVSPKIKADIADFSDFRKKSIGGKLGISRDGLPVDTVYKELVELYPDLFSDEIWNETDQFLRMVEVANLGVYEYDSYMLDDGTIQEAVNIIAAEVGRYKQNITRTAAEEAAREAADSVAPAKATQIMSGTRGDALLVQSLDNFPIKTVEDRLAEKIRAVEGELADNRQLRREVIENYNKQISELAEEYAGLKNKSTQKALNIVNRVSKLERLKASADADYAKRISDLEARVERMHDPKYGRAMQKQDKMEADAKWAADLLGDTSTWKDKKIGLQYATNTERRNLRDIVRDANGNADIAKADAIDDALNGQYNRDEAEKKRELAKVRKKYADLKITKAEDAYIQMLGEFRGNPETTITEKDISEYYEKNKGKIDTEKVDKIIEMARQDYDEWLNRVNAELKKQGMKEIPYRKGYFPHFTEPKQNFIQKLLNWKTQDNEIPTSIAGLTETFKPTRSWQSFDKTRHSDETDYSFMKGFDSYSEGALDWIYHMDTLQKRRAVENHIRFTHSDEGIQARIKEVYANEKMDANEAQAQIEHILTEAKNPLNNFVQDFTTHTNILAGKKNSLDRTVEQGTNRHIYSVMTNVQNRMSANMVLANVRSALTNFIPITQSWAQVSPLRSLQAAKETIANSIKDDGTVDKSTFLTNRLREVDKLYQTNWDKVLDKAGIMFEIVDNFSSQVIWRSKYNQNLADGMSEKEAIRNADQFAENVMAGRSKGNEPTLFNAKNPFVKAFTMFQLEVNNQYGYLFKDVPNDLKAETEHWKFNLVKGYTTAFIGAYVYNALLEKVTGSDAALDPIGIIEELLRDLGLFDDDEEEEKIGKEEAINAGFNLLGNVAEELPFVGGVLGGGRVPISSAMPYGGEYDGGLRGFVEDVGNIGNGGLKNIGKEMMNPILNVGLPVAGNQLKKTYQGLKMFSDEHPVSGSYTDSGNLRFPVEDTPLNRVQAAIFGQYASKNAREYFDNDYAPLKEKQIQEYIDVDIPIKDYWEYREGLKGKTKAEEKMDYISGLDLPTYKKNILANNALDRKDPVDLENYEDFGSLEEFDFATKNPEKYAFAKSVGGYAAYKTYSSELYDIHADKDENGKSINGSRKEKVVNYINNLDADYYTKIILFKSEYPSDDTYNYELVNYINNHPDLSYTDRVSILTELGFRVTADGKIYAD